MLLAIDIGNTNIKLGLWEGHSWQREWRLNTEHSRTADEFGVLLTSLLREEQLRLSIASVVISSVVPTLTATFQQLCQKYLNVTPLIVGVHLAIGIQLLTDNPAAVGADRIANSVAAYKLVHGPCIVIDMGTATTFDVVSAAGDLLGGAFVPGLKLMANALGQQTAQLGQVPLSAPPHAIGRNTSHAMQSGTIFGYASLIEGLVKRLMAEYPGEKERIKVVGTGGLISLISAHTEIFDYVDPWLTLNGARLIFEAVNDAGNESG